MNKVKTIVIITPGFPVNEADSTCIPPQQIFVKALKQERPELNLIILTLQYPFFSGEYGWHGIKVISFGGENKGRIFSLFTNIRVWEKLKRLKKENPSLQLLSFWFGKCAFLADHFARRHQLTHYSWILGQDAKPGNKYFKKINPGAESLIALSDFIAEEFNRNYKVKPKHLIPVGIDTSLFNTSTPERHIDIIGAGNLVPLKQYPVFLEIVHALKSAKPDIKAVICGDGPEMKGLSEMVKNLELQDHVTLRGRMAHADVLLLMQQSRIFIHTSNYEGFGAVCLEALYAGTRVVSFVQPMKTGIPNWHIAASTPQMINITRDLLNEKDTIYQPVLPFTIQDNVRKMMQLFDASSSQ